MWHSVAYSEFPLPATPPFPNGHVAHRPVLKLELVNGTNRFPCLAIVDSGADHCMFPLSFALQLGLDPLSADKADSIGIGGISETYYWNITLDFGPTLRLSVYAGFSATMESIGFGLLGQTGFFSQVKTVAFDRRNGRFGIELEDLPQPPTAPPNQP